MAVCHFHAAATWQGDTTLTLPTENTCGRFSNCCTGMACRSLNPLTGLGEPSCLQRSIPRFTLNDRTHHVRRIAGPRTPMELNRFSHREKNSTRQLSSKQPIQQPVAARESEEREMEETSEPVSIITDEKKEAAALEEKMIKVEKKGAVAQLQSLFAWVSAWPSIPSKEEFIEVPKKPGVFVIWEGWGTSLCWWANFVGGLPKENFDYVVDLLFDSQKGLGMNIVRYNIGGGADLKFDTNLRPFGDIPGFKPGGPDASYDWSADKRQRDVLFAARERGADIFEAFNNSPPHWMTYSGSVTGNWKKSQDNLDPKYYEAFADYLTEVVLQYKKWGLQFDTLAPFNEPCEGWWYIDRNKAAQEGCNFAVRSMDKVIPMVKKSLAKKNLATRLSAFDAWTNNTVQAFRGMSKESLQAIDQVNAHTYIFWVQREDDAKRTEVSRNILAGGKKLWMSEYGPLNWDGDEHDVALAVARHITLDINDLHPSAWCYWQALEGPGSLWGLLQTPLVYGTSPFVVDLKKQYYIMMHFTRWIRPGFKVYKSEGLRDFLVSAVNPLGSTVVIVLTNTSGQNKDVEYDLSDVAPSLRGTRIQVAPFRTSRIENHAELPVLNFPNSLLEIRSVAKSVMTLVVSCIQDEQVRLFEKAS